MDEQARRLIFAMIDQTISPDDFERLQELIEHDETVRAEYLRAVHLSESLGEIASEEMSNGVNLSDHVSLGVRPVAAVARFSIGQFAVAASLLLLASGAAFWMGTKNVPGPISEVSSAVDSDADISESLIAGHATLRRSADIRWTEGDIAYREGDVLPDGLLRFTEGVAEVDFFCGATLIVEGPASLEIESDWSVRVNEGRLRASVPPAARGFTIKAADSEIVDLGTEFALDVGPDNAAVEVIDGEVELRGGKHDGTHLLTGERRWLMHSAVDTDSFEGLSTQVDVQRRRQDALSKRFAEWNQHVAECKSDKRLIAYFPIGQTHQDRMTQRDRVVINSAPDRLGSDAGDCNGVLVGPVERTLGRFGERSSALEFDRPGARVRTLIDGEFSAFTFACWVKIDSLEHRYNALFMGDGYENGEPHWQIRDDGKLMFSVMVDDRPGTGDGPTADARLHRVYFTDPIWGISLSGRWMHVAAVYDPSARRVAQFVDGEQISIHEIADRFHVTKLKIGPSEMGNWGQPLRKTPWFAVRNLNGAIDELSIYDAALAPDEIRTLYEKGKPLGY